MNNTQISIVRETFEQISPHMSRVSRVMYDQLFEIDPRYRLLFKSDLRQQRKRFNKSFAFIINNLHHPQLLQQIFSQLAASHKAYGVKKESFEDFGKALMFAVSAALGDDYTPEVKEAWQAMYLAISGVITDRY